MNSQPNTDMDVDPQQRKRRNIVLFVVHLLVACAVFGYYIWSVSHSGA
jgi:flagellar basal body-associated protein FliL